MQAESPRRSAVPIPWLPDWAGKEGRADRLRLLVHDHHLHRRLHAGRAVSVFSLWKFRAAPEDDSDGPPIHGHTGLEIAWTALPVVLVTAIAIVSAVVLAQNSTRGRATRSSSR